MSTKVKNSKMEATRVIMTPLGSAASNVFNMLNMSFFLVFSTEALGLNIAVMGIVMTVMGLQTLSLVRSLTEQRQDLVSSDHS